MKNSVYVFFWLAMSLCDTKNVSAAQPAPQIPQNQGQPNFELLKQKSRLDVFRDNKTRFSHLVQQNPQASLQWMASQVSSNPQTEQKLKKRVEKYGLIGQCVAQVGSEGFNQLSEQERTKLAQVMGYKDFQFIYADGALKDPAITQQVTPLLKGNILIRRNLSKDLVDQYELRRRRELGQSEQDAKTGIILEHIKIQTSWYQTFDDQIAGIVARNNPQELNRLRSNLGHYLAFDEKRLKTSKARKDLADFAVRTIDQIKLTTLESLMFLPQFRTCYATYLVQNGGAAAAPKGPLKVSKVDPKQLARLVSWRDGSDKTIDQLARHCVQHFDQLPKATQHELVQAGTRFEEMYLEHKIAQDDPSWINNMDDAELERTIDPAHNCFGAEKRTKIAQFCFKHRDKLKPEIVKLARKENECFRNMEQNVK